VASSQTVPAGLVRVGISGWRYGGWRGVFYPPDLAQSRELAYAGRHFDTIEINGSFYSLQRPESYRRWYDDTPAGFSFAVKGGRFITHMKKLNDVEVPLANFFASGVLALADKLGPVLWQFPADLRFDAAKFAQFFALLPRDSEAAAALAQRSDHRVRGRAWLTTDRRRPIRHAVEIRHPSFADPGFVALLRRHRIALVFADSVEWPYFEDVTADFVYLRLHGSETLYASGYKPAELDRWAARIAAWARGGEPADAKRIVDRAPTRLARRRVYVYFDNDAKVKAPGDALALAKRLEKLGLHR
jgi:uncharacterized protein YecE (DUF72 family)